MTRPTESGNRIDTWTLLGEKPGDNNQVLALAKALGYPYQQKHLAYRHTELLSNLMQIPTLRGVSKSNSDPLQPPWPDLLISAGRRSEPVAQWIKEQSGQRTRLVHIGRPWRHPSNYDLVISTKQYYLQETDSILVNRLPLHRIKQQQLADEAKRWQPRLCSYPPPYTALLVGGNSGAYRYDRKMGKTLGALAGQKSTLIGGSLLITSSRRTPAGFLQSIMESIALPCYLHRWSANDKDNPYAAFLGLAQQIIVTGESVSMVTEAVTTGKPVYLFDPRNNGNKHWLNPANLRWQSLSHRLVQHLAPKRLRRDILPLLDELVQQKQAAWLSDTSDFVPETVVEDDLQRSVLAVRQMLAG